MASIYGIYLEESYKAKRKNETLELCNLYNEILGEQFCYIDESIFKNSDEYIVVNEIYFSKKDLQNPETLKKLLKRAETEKNIKKKLDHISFLFTFIEALIPSIFIGKNVNIGAGVSSYIPLLIAFLVLTNKIISKMNSFMIHIHEARINKLLKQAIKLRDKAKQNNQSEIANNCQKVIDAIEKHYKNIEDEKFKKLVNGYKSLYKYLIDIINSKKFMEEPDPEVFNLAKILKIPYSRIDEGMKKKSIDNNAINYWFGTDNIDKITKDESIKEKFYKIIKYIPEFKTGEGCIVYYAIDDTVFEYSPKSGYFGYGEYYVENMEFDKSIFNIVESRMDDVDDFDMDALKIADAELGYYRLSEAPEGVTPKKI